MQLTTRATDHYSLPASSLILTVQWTSQAARKQTTNSAFGANIYTTAVFMRNLKKKQKTFILLAPSQQFLVSLHTNRCHHLPEVMFPSFTRTKNIHSFPTHLKNLQKSSIFYKKMSENSTNIFPKLFRKREKRQHFK